MLLVGAKRGRQETIGDRKEEGGAVKKYCD
jgi:hypothetical protein